MIKGITFDFWSTLFRLQDPHKTNETRVNNVQETLKVLNIHVDDAELKAAIRKVWQEAYYEQRAWGRDIGPRGQVNKLVGMLELPQDPAMTEKIYQAYISALNAAPPVLITHVPKVLDYVSRRYVVGLICNTGATPGVMLREIMARNGILKFFITTVFSDELCYSKPAPEIFKHTLDLMGVEPNQAIHVGDDPLTDVIGAKRAGMKSVWFAPEEPWTVPECDWHINEMDELMRIIK